LLHARQSFAAISQVACRGTVFSQAPQLLGKASQFRLNCCRSSRSRGNDRSRQNANAPVRCEPKGNAVSGTLFERWSW